MSILRVSVGLLLLSVCHSGCEAVLCYSCTYQGPHTDIADYLCVIAPTNVTTGSTTVNCPNGCTASSQVIIDNGVVMSLSRGCYFNNTVTTHCTNIDSSGERHCDLICDTHLCNGATSIDTNPPIDTSNPNVAPSTHLAPVALLLVIATILLIVSL